MFKSWVNTTVNEQQKRSEEYHNQQRKKSQKHREGEIFITKTKDSQNSKSDKIGGEYVDYEEIKD